LRRQCISTRFLYFRNFSRGLIFFNFLILYMLIFVHKWKYLIINWFTRVLANYLIFYPFPFWLFNFFLYLDFLLFFWMFSLLFLFFFYTTFLRFLRILFIFFRWIIWLPYRRWRRLFLLDFIRNFIWLIWFSNILHLFFVLFFFTKC
jgi:hypothetical protein